MRKSWDIYFLELAEKIAERSTCDRAHVGCILVRDTKIIATGYNGSLPGQDHCLDVGHLMIEGHCRRVVHAEVNAVLQAAKYGISTDNTTCYCTHLPCLECLKMLIASGIKKVVYEQEYRPETIPSEFRNIIPIVRISKDTNNLVDELLRGGLESVGY